MPLGSALVSASRMASAAGTAEAAAAVLAAHAAPRGEEMAMKAETALDGAVSWSPSELTTTCVKRKAVTTATIQAGT
ncbi:hypothetical protein GCM10010485_22950 [Streptosporangium carneum]